MKQELFSNAGPEQNTLSKIRPLGPVSDYVCEELPDELNRLSRGQSEGQSFAQTVDQLITDLPAFVDRLGQSPSDLLLARLDLLFLEHAIVHSGSTPPSALTDLNDKVAAMTSRPAGLTYEDLIFTNPPLDLRHFMTGDVGRSEVDFYRGHQYIEEHLRTAILSAFELVARGQAQPETISGDLEGIAFQIEQALLYMGDFGVKLSPEHFKAFARFHDKNPDRPETKSAGGQFSSSMPTLDVLLAGKSIPEDIVKHWIDVLPFFPVYGQKEFSQAMEYIDNGGLSVSQIVSLRAKTDEQGALGDIDRKIRGFRGKHYKAVAAQLKEEMAGENGPRQFLRDRIQIQHS